MQDLPNHAGKASVSVSVDADLLAHGRASQVDLSSVFERALRDELAKLQRWEQWRADNRAAIEASNAELERNGLWCDEPQ